jgi:hypothetical protein
VVALHTTWEDGTLRCGACFDMKATPDFAAQREAIERFLTAQIREARTRTTG